MKIEVEKRVRAELDAEQSYARCEAVAGEATAEAERKDAQRKQGVLETAAKADPLVLKVSSAEWLRLVDGCSRGSSGFGTSFC